MEQSKIYHGGGMGAMGGSGGGFAAECTHGFEEVAWASTVQLDCKYNDIFFLQDTLGISCEFLQPQNVHDGQGIVIIIKNGEEGAAVTFNSSYWVFPSDGYGNTMSPKVNPDAFGDTILLFKQTKLGFFMFAGQMPVYPVSLVNSHNDVVAYADDGKLLLPLNIKLGAGTDEPDGIVHAFKGSAGTVTASFLANNVVSECSGDCGMTMLNPDDRISRLIFGCPSAASWMQLSGQYSASLVRFALPSGFEFKIHFAGIDGISIKENAAVIGNNSKITANDADGIIVNAINNKTVKLQVNGSDYITIDPSGTGITINAPAGKLISLQHNGADSIAITGTTVTINRTVFITGLVKSGATQTAAGAAENEVWITDGHATLPDRVMMLGGAV